MQHSQLAPLPLELPFRIVSKTIGQGAYACIKKGAPLKQHSPVFAVKFIHREYALRHGRIKPKQIQMETTLHKYIGSHNNIIEFYDTGSDPVWTWIAMELAEGGDLFDKIEADEGVTEDIAHVYISQLVSAVGYMHSKGVGHRDLKPENILLSVDGDLKMADFGLATLFEHNGKRKACTTLCGSPPYVAPEVLRVAEGKGYEADMVDIWSCGVVLFVLLAGNTPWATPVEAQDEEYREYVQTNGRPNDELWQTLPADTLSLLRGMMRVDPRSRFSLEDVRRHPWFTRPNKYMRKDGRLVNPLALATSMFESLRVSFDSDPLSQRLSGLTDSMDSMEIDSQPVAANHFSSTQPDIPGEDMLSDWERRPARLALSSTQPTDQSILLADRLADEPSMSQFAPTPSVPLSRTQMARKFQDILPAHSLTRFFSFWTLKLLVPLITEALHRLAVPTPGMPNTWSHEMEAYIKVRTKDGRACLMTGDIAIGVAAEGLLQVTFIRLTGDPLEWRRFFKQVVVLCKDAVYKPET